MDSAFRMELCLYITLKLVLCDLKHCKQNFVILIICYYILVQSYHRHRLDKQMNRVIVRLSIKAWQHVYISKWQQVHKGIYRFVIP